MSAARVISISPSERHSFTPASGVPLNPSSVQEITNLGSGIDVLQSNLNRVLDPDELYSSLESHDSDVIQVLRLLRNCRESLIRATAIDPVEDFISYDEHMMRVRDSLRRLFDLRVIGDGFGATINAMIWALGNVDMRPLSRPQILTVLEVIDQLRKRPLLRFESSMGLLDQLEAAELEVEPPFADLVEDFEI
jgi:hypothetical protein